MQLDRLLEAGIKVALAGQIGEGEGDGVMRRQVTELLTRSTDTNEARLRPEANYLTAVVGRGSTYALALLELSTGEFSGTLVDDKNLLLAELRRTAPTEVILEPALGDALESEIATIALVSEAQPLDVGVVQRRLEVQIRNAFRRL